MAKVIATAANGDPLVAHVVEPPGCLERLGAGLRRALTWLVVVGAAFAAGYGCKAAGGDRWQFNYHSFKTTE